MPSKKYRVDLSEEERNPLQALIANRSSSSPAVKRAYALLAADEQGEKNWPDLQIQQTYGLSRSSIERLRERLVLEGFAVAVTGKKREVFVAKRLTGEIEAKLIALGCSSCPSGYTRWTLRLVADEMVRLEYVEQISDESVRQILKKNALKPWQVKHWVIPSADAAFVCQMEQVLWVYERAYDESHPVVCLDESPKQLVSEARIGFIDSKGITHVDYEYKREGLADVYMLVEPLRGYRKVLVEQNHKSATYAKVLAHLVEDLYPTALKITLIEDNLSAHRVAALYEVFPAARARNIIQRLEIVRTPAHGSWLNIAECELSVLKRQGLQQRIPNIDKLEKQAKEWYEQRNSKQTKGDWQFTTKEARIKLRHLYPSINT